MKYLILLFTFLTLQSCSGDTDFMVWDWFTQSVSKLSVLELIIILILFNSKTD